MCPRCRKTVSRGRAGLFQVHDRKKARSSLTIPRQFGRGSHHHGKLPSFGISCPSRWFSLGDRHSTGCTALSSHTGQGLGRPCPMHKIDGRANKSTAGRIPVIIGSSLTYSIVIYAVRNPYVMMEAADRTALSPVVLPEATVDQCALLTQYGKQSLQPQSICDSVRGPCWDEILPVGRILLAGRKTLRVDGIQPITVASLGPKLIGT